MAVLSPDTAHALRQRTATAIASFGTIQRMVLDLPVDHQTTLLRCIAAHRDWAGTPAGDHLIAACDAMDEELREEIAAEDGASDPYFSGVSWAA